MSQADLKCGEVLRDCGHLVDSPEDSPTCYAKADCCIKYKNGDILSWEVPTCVAEADMLKGGILKHESVHGGGKLMEARRAYNTFAKSLRGGDETRKRKREDDGMAKVMLDKLVKYVINPRNTPKHTDTVLHMAAMDGHPDIVKLLLDAGMNVDVRNKYGATPLNHASVLGRYDVVKMLLNAGADVNAETFESHDNGDTPVEVAAWNGNGRVVKLLLDSGANQDSDLIDYAVSGAWNHGGTRAVKVLVKDFGYELDGSDEELLEWGGGGDD